MIFKDQHYQIESYEFQQIKDTDGDAKVKNFQLKELAASRKKEIELNDEIIRAERDSAKENGFNFFEVVSEYRGQKKQAQQDYEKRVEEEVKRRVKEIESKAYEEGFNKGKDEGFAEVKKIESEKIQASILKLEKVIEEAQNERLSLMQKNKDEIYSLVKTLVKWVSFREFKKDSYLPTLLEKLILELNEKHNLLIKVNREDFEAMPKVIEAIEENLGKLTNCRLEIEPGMKQRGLVLESERGIIDASIDVQFSKIDKLFENIEDNDE